MKYDFGDVIERRGTGSIKWAKALLGPLGEGIPLWIADMDFPVAQPVVDALKLRAQHPIYGYGFTSNSTLDSIVNRLERKYRWHVEREWIFMAPGAIPLIRAAVRALTRPGDGILIHTPGYPPFFAAASDYGRIPIASRLCSAPVAGKPGRYEMNFDGMEAAFRADAPVRPGMMVLCNPHNPVGSMWTRDELIRAGEMAFDAGAVVVSDELHCEIVFGGRTHVPFGSISNSFAEQSLVIMGPGKNFNLSGLPLAFCVIPGARLRERFVKEAQGLVGDIDIFAIDALSAAYDKGDEWLEQVLVYIDENIRFAVDFIGTRMPVIKTMRPEGTYLLWLDCRGLGVPLERVNGFFQDEAGVLLNDGAVWGPDSSGLGFQRMNVACPRSTLEKGLSKMEQAIRNRLERGTNG